MHVRPGATRDDDLPASSSASSPVDTVVQLERSHGSILATFVGRVGVDRSSSVEVAQEALLRLYRELMSGVAITDVRAWTFRVAYRLAIDELRRSDRERRMVQSSVAPPSVPPPDDDVERRVVWEMVDELPPRQREVIYLRYRADLTFDGVASVLGITASAARSHATQAMTTLRDIAAREQAV